jgi:HSP20 family protein
MTTYSDAVRSMRRMPADAYRDGDHYVLAVELPGVDPTSIDVDVDGQTLTVKAERPARSAEGTAWITRERWSGAVERRFALGRSIDTAAISASYDNGVLSVSIPVSEAAKPRKVEVVTAA